MRGIPAGLALSLLLAPLAATAQTPAGSSPDVVSFEHSDRTHAVRLPAGEGLEPAVAQALSDTRIRLAALGPQDSASQAAEALGDAALLLLAHEFWRAADDALIAAELLVPEDFRWSYYRAWGASRSGDLPRALDLYQRALTKRAGHLPTLVRSGRLAIESGQLERGRALLLEALRLSPEEPAALAALGQLALEEDQTADAIDLLTRALKGASEADALYFPLAMAYRASGDLDRARAAMAQRGTVGVDVPDPLLDRLEGASAGATAAGLRGRAAFAAGRYREAAAEFERALEADPDRIDIRVNLGAALGEAGEIDLAIAEYQEILRREPDHPLAHLNLSQLLVQRGEEADLEPLLVHSARAADLLPADDEAQRLAARVAARNGDTTAALAAYRRAVQANPRNEANYLEGAVLLVGASRYAEAIAVLDAGLAVLPDQGRLLHLLARLLAGVPDPDLRDGERALGYAEAVARQQPQTDHLRTLAMAYAEVGRCDEAAEVIDKLQADLAPQASPELTELSDRFRNQRPCRMPYD